MGGQISIEEFEKLFKDNPEKLAILYSKNFQNRIFGIISWIDSKRTREQITSEEIDKLYEEYCEIKDKVPQDLFEILRQTSYDKLVEANKQGFLNDASFIQNWSNMIKQMPSFVPLRLYLLRDEFVNYYSVQELSNFSENDELIKRMDKYGLLLLRLLPLEKLEEKSTPEYIDDTEGEELPCVIQYHTPQKKEDYNIAKFVEDLLSNDKIREIVSSFRSSKNSSLSNITELLYQKYSGTYRGG